MNLSFDGTSVLNHSTVDEFADHDFAVEQVALGMLRFGFGGGRDCDLEAWVATTVGPQFAYSSCENHQSFIAARSIISTSATASSCTTTPRAAIAAVSSGSHCAMTGLPARSAMPCSAAAAR